MINYQSQNPSRNFIMLERGIDEDLSPDAYYLLVKLMKLAPNENNSNDALKQKTGFSKRKFDRAKKELVDKGYLSTKQLYGNKYALYIGKESVHKHKSYERNKSSGVHKYYIDGIKM